MIYITFFYPYLLIIYCIKNVNKEVFGNNKVLINVSTQFRVIYAQKKN